MSTPNPLPTDVANAVTSVVAWYKSKPLYAGAVIGFFIGQALYHWFKL
jgi:hypothetical protein